MRKCKRRFTANRSGQLLIVAALAIAILISSTTLYVYELSTESNNSSSQSISSFTLALKQSTRNAVISSLANVSNGGERTVLTKNLNELSQGFRSLYSYGMCGLTFTLLNDSAYDSGMWLSWNTTVLDVSSAYANFTLNVRGDTAEATVSYAVNVTTAFAVNGSYVFDGAEKSVSLTCRVFNEGELALASNMKVYYESSGGWIQIDAVNLTNIDYGNGTYLQSFVVPLDVVHILVEMVDLRGVMVQAKYDM
jgi:hypothetical protein